MDRLNKVVGGTASSTSATPSSLKHTVGASKPAASAADRKKQIQQLVDLGVSVPDEYRADMALGGDWKVVSQRTIEEPVIDESLNKGIRKRKVEGQEEEEEAGETVVRRGWGSTTKRYPGEGTDDLDALFSMNPLKKKGEKEIIKKEDEPPAKIDRPTATLAETTQPSPESGNDNPMKTKIDDAEDHLEPNLPGMANEPSAPVFKKRKQKPLVG